MGEQKPTLVSHCVGRDVIEVPAAFAAPQIVTGQFKTREMTREDESIELLLHVAAMTDMQFPAEVAKVRSELAGRTSGKVDVVRLERKLAEQVVLFRVQEIDDAYKSEIVFQRSGSLIRASLESFNNQFGRAEDILLAFVNSIEPMPQPPSAGLSHGFCLGKFVITAELNDEAASFQFKDGTRSTIGVDVDTYAEDEAIPLLTRVTGPDSLLTKLSINHRVLRAGERMVSGMKAQEWLGWARTDETEEAYAFSLETMRSIPGKTAPMIHLSLDTRQPFGDGRQPGKALSDKDAISLWDLIVSSIRIADR